MPADVANLRRCLLCDVPLETRFQSVFDAESGEVFSIESCPECKFGATYPVPADLARYYAASYYGGRHGVTNGLCNRRRQRFVRLALGINQRDKRLLDVGCGDGSFMIAAEQAGFQVFGTELAKEAPRSRGLEVETTHDKFDPSLPFDVITLWHALEHFSDLDAILQGLRKQMHAEGCLLIAVPDARSFQARFFGSRWLHLDVPRHFWHFSRASLEKLLIRHRFDVVFLRASEFEYDLMGWVQSLLDGWLASPRGLMKLLTNRETPIPRSRKWLHFAIGFTLFGILAAPVWLAGRIGRGGTLVVVAKPHMR
ncbi:MAG: class I SAM-dependent methyltransferase [Pirellulaceae bacterium]|nr:class I SAM-dependent methyltransferase [Pirellulaceae bacterium]